MSPASNTSGAPLPSVAILGVDALLAARPATPVQLAHACQAAGYAAVYPVTWGDELLATACMRRVAARGDDPVIFCACPHVSDALLEVGTDLARFLVPLVAPPVACARYLRALYGYNRVRITYIGACPGAHDPAIDATLTPVQFFGVLTQLGIALQEQPEVFESVLPPDRRRHRSLPGGAPTSEMLTIDGRTRTLEEIIDDDWKTELAQRLLLRHRAVFDVAPALGCHCAGARPGVAPGAARPAVIALEPPRSSSDVIDANVAVDVDRTLPFIATRIREIPSVPVVVSQPDEQIPITPPAPPAPSLPTLPSTSEEVSGAEEEEAPRRKAAAPVVARAAQGVPLARTEGGQVLPRAYAARRRTPPDGRAVVSPPVTATPERIVETPLAAEAATETATSESVPATPVVTPLPSEDSQSAPPPPASNRARVVVGTGVAMVAIALVALVALRPDDGRVTTESRGFAAPASGVLDSLPPLPFPLPDTAASQAPLSDSTAVRRGRARLDSIARSLEPDPSRPDR